MFAKTVQEGSGDRGALPSGDEVGIPGVVILSQIPPALVVLSVGGAKRAIVRKHALQGKASEEEKSRIDPVSAESLDQGHPQIVGEILDGHGFLKKASVDDVRARDIVLDVALVDEKNLILRIEESKGLIAETRDNRHLGWSIPPKEEDSLWNRGLLDCHAFPFLHDWKEAPFCIICHELCFCFRSIAREKHLENKGNRILEAQSGEEVKNFPRLFFHRVNPFRKR